jgi:hypothetical protein
MTQFRDKPLMEVLRMRLDPRAIANAMQVPEQAVFRVMAANGRAVSFWAPYWVSLAYDLPIDELNREADTTSVNGDFGELGVARAVVRSLARGKIQFQRNFRIGKGRWCSQQDLIEDIHAFDRCVVVSAGKFPIIQMYPLNSHTLLSEALGGRLTASGITAKRFVEWISERHQIMHRDL